MSDGYREMAASREHWDAKRDAEIERLERELTVARRDAERYRWLRNTAVDHDTSPWCVAWNDPHDSREGEHPCGGKELDAAIDAFLKDKE